MVHRWGVRRVGTQEAAAHLVRLLAEPGPYRRRWERASLTASPPGEIHQPAVCAVLAGWLVDQGELSERDPAPARKIRDRVRSCGQANLGTSVTALRSRSDKHQEITVWALSIEVSDDHAVPFLMGVVRDGNTVSQVGFTPHGEMTMSRPDFVDVAERALQRLSNLPGSGR